uniref:Uncharacterized protein n=1 Tax=Anguilla anguilla TaxID=7936 RepID=A0A0E9WT18_ANGAN
MQFKHHTQGGLGNLLLEKITLFTKVKESQKIAPCVESHFTALRQWTSFPQTPPAGAAILSSNLDRGQRSWRGGEQACRLCRPRQSSLSPPGTCNCHHCLRPQYRRQLRRGLSYVL